MTFSLEQILQLFAIACEKPEDYERPISHWTARELAEEVIKQGIVLSISHAMWEIDGGSRCLLPHQSQYWLNPDPRFD